MMSDRKTFINANNDKLGTMRFLKPGETLVYPTVTERRDLTTVNALILSSARLLALAVSDQTTIVGEEATRMQAVLAADRPGTVEGVNMALESVRREAFALAELASRTQTRIEHLLAQAATPGSATP